MLAHQGWISFFNTHQVYYPPLVQEFYGNLRKVEDKLVTLVRGSQITVKLSMFTRALDIPASGATLDMHVPLEDALIAMTQDDEV